MRLHEAWHASRMDDLHACDMGHKQKLCEGWQHKCDGGNSITAAVHVAKHGRKGSPKISSRRSKAPWVQMMKRPRWPPGASCRSQQFRTRHDAWFQHQYSR